MKAKIRPGEKGESEVVTLGPTDGQGDPGYDPGLAEQFVYERLALKEQQKLNQVGLAIIRNIDTYHLRETDKLKAKLRLNPDAKSWRKFKEKVRTSRTILDLHAIFRDNLVEFRKALDEVTDPKLRYRIARHSREMAAYARILGNIARRNAFEERRDQINGRKSTTIPNPKTVERQRRIEEKVKAILRVDLDAEWNAVWRKVWKDQSIRGLAKSRNTIEKYARIAYCENNLLTPSVDERLL